MANPASTNVGELSRFTTLPVLDQQVIVWRAEGHSYKQIAAGLLNEFGAKKSEETIRTWFAPGGRLEQAYLDYNQELADASVKRAKQLAQRLSENAIATLGDLMKETQDGTVRLGAAKALANKYIPDRQVIVGATNEDDIPAELAGEGEEALSAIRGDTPTDGAADAGEPSGGDEQNADAPGSDGTPQEAGQPEGEAVAEGVLQQPDNADNGSVPAA